MCLACSSSRLLDEEIEELGLPIADHLREVTKLRTPTSRQELRFLLRHLRSAKTLAECKDLKVRQRVVRG